jgi:iron complex transport system substrate-binding protein
MKWQVLLFFLLVSCQFSRHDKKVTPAYISGNHFASGFTVRKTDAGYRLTVHNPWEKAARVQFEYFLVNGQDPLPDSLSGKMIIRVPVKRVICLSTSHLAFLNQLDELGKVTGISGARYVTNPLIQKGIREDIVRDVGYGSNLNYEEIIRQKPDLVLLYGVDAEISGYLEKFRDLGIPAVIIAEYLESNPLGKAEWIKFVAPFFGREEMADSLFSATEKRYLEWSGLAAHLADKPGVMVGLPYRDAWWIPGGESYMARLISDAGGNYLGGDNRSRESYVISMEDAIHLFSGARFWINTGMISHRSEILAMDSRFEKLAFFRNARIFNNNKHATPAGGMDFWESGTIKPDLILRDLISVFHPGIVPADSLNYYREIR